jgi:hypothetical protein
MNVANTLSALSNLDGLSLGGFLDPLKQPVAKAADAASQLKKAVDSLLGAFSQ